MFDEESQSAKFQNANFFYLSICGLRETREAETDDWETEAEVWLR